MDKAAKHTSAWADAATGQMHPARSHEVHARVRSFSRAGGRLRASQHAALERHGDSYLVQVPRRDAIRTVDPDFVLDPQQVFGRRAPLIVEVGPGGGEALLAAAKANPDTDFFAVEVWETAIAKIVSAAAAQALDNVKGADTPTGKEK